VVGPPVARSLEWRRVARGPGDRRSRTSLSSPRPPSSTLHESDHDGDGHQIRPCRIQPLPRCVREPRLHSVGPPLTAPGGSPASSTRSATRDIPLLGVAAPHGARWPGGTGTPPHRDTSRRLWHSGARQA
jgi:hypothetical protein